MSEETRNWGKEIVTGHPVTKAVLRELCNWARPDGCVEYLSLKRMAVVCEVSTRTVQRHLNRLEHELKLIERIERHREDGGQGANSFVLLGYKPPENVKRRPRDKMSSPHDNLSRGVRQNDGGAHDTGVTRYRNKILPPSSPDGEDTPADDLEEGSGEGEPQAADKPKPERGHRLPEDWTAPAVDDLPPEASRLVRQWPAGAYEAKCAVFKLNWLTETRAIGCKKNWTLALGKWLINDHGSVMRDAKFGVDFAPAPPVGGAARPVRKFRPVPSAVLEDQRSAAVRAELEIALGKPVMEEWFSASAILLAPPLMTVVSRADFTRQFCEQHYGRAILAAATKVTKGAVKSVRWSVEVRKPKEIADDS
ncbi:MAG TPA: hypothetical protein VF503_09045 [Sphingobium sp.]|uniref:hypothetical protein n=1 Tax=Sphingobium sp. TaxID=1912891 RepID=UPI002ED05CE2